jgi:hypothetical protein
VEKPRTAVEKPRAACPSRRVTAKKLRATVSNPPRHVSTTAATAISTSPANRPVT